MGNLFQQNTAEDYQRVLDAARKDSNREFLWSAIMASVGHKVGAEVSAREVHDYLSERGQLSYVSSKARGHQLLLLVEEGYLKRVYLKNGQPKRVTSPDDENQHHQVRVYRVVKVFRTDEEWEQHRAALAERDRRIEAYTLARARETARIRAARGLSGNKNRATA